MNKDNYIGLSLEEAKKLADERGLLSRVMRLDKENFVLTCDYYPDRVNLEIDEGVVTNVEFH